MKPIIQMRPGDRGIVEAKVAFSVENSLSFFVGGLGDIQNRKVGVRTVSKKWEKFLEFVRGFHLELCCQKVSVDEVAQFSR